MQASSRCNVSDFLTFLILIKLLFSLNIPPLAMDSSMSCSLLNRADLTEASFAVKVRGEPFPEGNSNSTSLDLFTNLLSSILWGMRFQISTGIDLKKQFKENVSPYDSNVNLIIFMPSIKIINNKCGGYYG